MLGMGATEDGRAARTRLTVGSDPNDTTHPYIFLVRMVVAVSATDAPSAVTPVGFAQANAVALLVPFVREVIANLTMRGRFGPVWVNPVNLSAVLLAAAQHQVATSQQITGTQQSQVPPEARRRKRKGAG